MVRVHIGRLTICLTTNATTRPSTLTDLWLILKSDKKISAVRVAEAIGFSQPTAQRMGPALLLPMIRQHPSQIPRRWTISIVVQMAVNIEGVDDAYDGSQETKVSSHQKVTDARRPNIAAFFTACVGSSGCGTFPPGWITYWKSG